MMAYIILGPSQASAQLKLLEEHVQNGADIASISWLASGIDIEETL
jgi:hypothetical protein